MHRLLRSTLLALTAATSAVTTAAAQVTTVDRGTFTILRDGAAVGREEFEIRALPGIDGASMEARATVTLDGRAIHPTLSARASGAPLAYRVEVRRGSEVVERATGQTAGGRLRVDAQGAGGRSAREFAAGDGLVVLDDAVFHQYHFVARPGAVTAVSPRRNVQQSLRVSAASSDRVTIGGRDVAATRYTIADPAGERTLWVDAEGRVLRVVVPALGLTAERDDPPR